MDFFFETKATDTDTEQETDKPIDTKTNDNFKTLENQVSSTFNLFQTKANSLFESTTLKNFKLDQIDDQLNNLGNNLSKKLNIDQLNLEKLKIDQDSLRREISSKTSGYLDDLDKELETVENIATDYVFKIGGFLKNSIKINAPLEQGEGDEQDELIDENEAGLLFNVNNGLFETYSNFNFKNEQYKIFLQSFNLKEFVKLDDKELSQIQQKLGYDDIKFWSVYYFLKESNKRRSVNEIENLNEKDEVIDWDESDNDDNDTVETPDDEQTDPLITKKVEKAGKVNANDDSKDKDNENDKNDKTNKGESESEVKDDDKEESDDDWE